jgi:hypothetical protein
MARRQQLQRHRCRWWRLTGRRSGISGNGGPTTVAMADWQQWQVGVVNGVAVVAAGGGCTGGM